MTGLAALLTKNPGDPFGLTNYAQLKINNDYLVVAGADLAALAGSNTLAVTNRFHKVTLAGGSTIDNLDALTVAAVKGQRYELWFQNQQTVRHQGGGTGNIRTSTGQSVTIPAGATAIFDFDGTNFWLTGGFAPGQLLDAAQITANTGSITATTEGTATAVITGNSVTYDGSSNLIEFFFPGSSTTANPTPATFVFLRDSTVLGQAHYFNAVSDDDSHIYRVFDTPAAGAHTYKVACFMAAGNLTIKAGPGGSGQLVPAYLRVARA